MTPDRLLDEGLVKRVRAGSREAAEELAERHWRPAWRVARGITGDAALAEDVVQEAMMPPSGRWTGSTPRGRRSAPGCTASR